jgi:malate dehydrogenase
MDISIVGAAGTIGRQIAIALVQARIPGPEGRLQLIGRRGGASERVLFGLASDLRDAHGEELPELDLALDPADVRADVVILAAGATVSGEPGGPRTRAELVHHNRPLAEQVARAMAAHGSGAELLLVLTNPVEALVETAAEILGPRRVVGLGAVLDTMRFRQEIADELGVRRQRVTGLVLGEHGLGMVPCWSTVSVHGLGPDGGRDRIARLRRPAPFPTVLDGMKTLDAVMRRDGIAAAYRMVEACDAGWRTVLRPFVTQFSGARTPVGSAATIARVLAVLAQGGQLLTAAQARLDGSWLGLGGTTGAPVVLSRTGIERIAPVDLAAEEIAALGDGRGVAALGATPPAGAVPGRSWLILCTMQRQDRPGMLARLSRVFAERGLSLDGLAAGPRHGRPTVVAACHADDALRDLLIGRLRRDPAAAEVRAEPADGRSPWSLLDGAAPVGGGGGW